MYPNRQLLLPLTLMAIGLVVFFGLATLVAGTNGLTGLDREVAAGLHGHALASAVHVQVSRSFTWMADKEQITAIAMVTLTLIIGLAIVDRQRRDQFLALGVMWVITVVGGIGLNLLMKGAFERKRPQFADALVHHKGFSFPSGHSMMAFVFYAMLAYLLLLAVSHRWARVVVCVTLGLLVMGVGFSRMYLGAHWLTDVIGGFMAGMVWVTFCITISEAIRRRLAKASLGAALEADS